MRYPILLLCSSLVCSSLTFGEELEETFEGVRPLGMGGAFTAVANDYNSQWTNPAGIPRIRKARTRDGLHYAAFPQFIIGANEEGRSFYAQYKVAGASTDEERATQLSSMIQTSSDSTSGKPFWLRGGMSPSIFFEAAPNKPVGLSFFSNSRMKVSLQSDDDSSITGKLESVTDVGAAIGLGLSNRSNRFNVGVQVRPMNRYAYDDKVSSDILFSQSALKSRITSEANVTSGVAIDAGFLFTLADFWFPTFGAAILNVPTGCQEDYLNPFAEKRQTVCGTKFSGTVHNLESKFLVDPTDIRLGVSMMPRLSRKLALRFAMDLHHLYLKSGENYYGLSHVETQKQVHAGVEVFLGNPLEINPLSVRFGYNQGFLTLGGSARFGFLAIELASYGKDISSSATPREDNRTVVSISAEY